MGRVRDSISRRGEGRVRSNAGVLLRSGGGFDMAGDAGGPSAFEEVHWYIDYTIILIILIIPYCRADKRRQHHSFLPGVC